MKPDDYTKQLCQRSPAHPLAQAVLGAWRDNRTIRVTNYRAWGSTISDTGVEYTESVPGYSWRRGHGVRINGGSWVVLGTLNDVARFVEWYTDTGEAT